MEIVINSTAQRVWRTPNILQLGFGPEHVVLENLLPRHEIFIEALYRGLTLEQAQVYARHLKLRGPETQALITALAPVLIKHTNRVRQVGKNGKTLASEIAAQDDVEPATLPIDSAAFRNALGEMNQASLKLSTRGESVWLRRQNRAVFIGTLDRVGALVAVALAQAGVGAIITGDLTESRIINLKSNLAALPVAPQLLSLKKLSERQISRIDLAVLIGQQLIEPQKFAAWMNRGTPTIGAIVASAAENLKPFLSHVIVPGNNPCWVCLEMSRKSNDTSWPDMASQIINRELDFDSASASLSLAGQIVDRVLSHIDATNGFETPSTSIEATGFAWQFHPDCRCRLGIC